MKPLNSVSLGTWAWGSGIALLILGFGSHLTAASASSPSSGLALRLELDRAVLPAAESQRAVVKITLAGPPPTSEAHRPPVNIDVKEDYYIIRRTEAQEEAIQLFDQGRDEDAVQRLRQSVDELKSAGGKYPAGRGIFERCMGWDTAMIAVRSRALSHR